MPINGSNYKVQNCWTTRVACAVLFLLFTFSWLYWFQADMLAVAQHGLSGGKTHYDRTVGAVISTVVLYLLHLLVYAIVRLTRRSHALTYFPSFLLLAFVSSVSYPFSWGAWLWAAPLLLLLWGGAVWLAKKVDPFANDTKEPIGLFSRRMWLNLLQLIVMMLGVAAVSDTNAVHHFKAHAEVALQHGDADEALRVGERSLETDESLTMLRIFALSQKGELGERLFCYPVVGSHLDVLPLLGSKAQLQLMADTVIWDHFGVRPDSIMERADSMGRARIVGSQLTASQYLDSLECDTLATLAYRDYKLVASLIDRQLDSFALQLPRYYALNDSLPRHYREALVLYQQLHHDAPAPGVPDTLFIYKDSLTTLRWQDFHQYDSIYPRKSERRIRTEKDFRGTYWYYYFSKD